MTPPSLPVFPLPERTQTSSTVSFSLLPLLPNADYSLHMQRYSDPRQHARGDSRCSFFPPEGPRRFVEHDDARCCGYDARRCRPPTDREPQEDWRCAGEKSGREAVDLGNVDHPGRRCERSSRRRERQLAQQRQ